MTAPKRLRLPLNCGDDIAAELRKVYRQVRLGAISPTDGAAMAAILAVFGSYL